MHAFTRPSQQLRLEVRQALLRSLHHTFLYRRLIVANKGTGARLQTVSQSIHKRINSVPRDGTTLLKFICGQLYNGKLAKRYGHALTDECPLCHRLGSCPHIDGECPNHEALCISRHNAACQLVYAAVHNTSKGGGILHAAPDLVLISADTCIQLQITEEGLDLLSTQLGIPSSFEGDDLSMRELTSPSDRLEPMPNPTSIHRMRNMDISQDPRYRPGGLSAEDGDSECTAVPCRIPNWVLSTENTHELHSVGHGTFPDLTYARGVPDSPHPNPNSFTNKICALIVVEIGFYRDLGCDTKLEAKTNKCSPPSSRPSRNIGVESNTLPSRSDTPAQRSWQPSLTSPPPSPPYDLEWSTQEPDGATSSPTRTTTPKHTTTSYSSRYCTLS